jgi:FKBP12-rapamycin complex-associated protein
MTVLRDNKESLLAVLEAFVYDPLINWRLMQTEVEGRRNEGEQFFCYPLAYLTDVC